MRYPSGLTRMGLGVLRGQKLNSARLTVIVSSPKPLDQIQPNSVCELLTCMGNATSKKILAWGGDKG